MGAARLDGADGSTRSPTLDRGHVVGTTAFVRAITEGPGHGVTMAPRPDVPRLALGTFPTPVARLDALCTERTALYVKHDDASGSLYGGNKVRKLEPILASAKQKGKARILTVGASGSHHVLATALYGRLHGFSVSAVLVPQARTAHAVGNLRLAIAAGLTPVAASGMAALPLRVIASMRPDTAFVSLGGSTVTGTMGFVAAGFELAEQVAKGELPEPDVVVVATGSGGTVAGLAVGLEAAGLRTTILAVAVAHPVVIFGAMMRRLVKQAAQRVPGVSARRAIARVRGSGDEIGKGYGLETEAGARASKIAREAGLGLDPTYTAKAFSAALGEVARSDARTVLFWHTLSSAPLAEHLATVPALPPSLEGLFT